MKNDSFINNYFSEMHEIIDKISKEDIDRAIEILFDAWKSGNKIFICGNGGSSSTATHFACDLSKSTIVNGKKRFKVIGLNDNIPLMIALVNDSGFDNLFSEQMINLFDSGDVLICISVHGGSNKDQAGLRSLNLLKAMMLANERNGKTIGFSGFDGGTMKEVADVCAVVPFNSTPHVESFHLAFEHMICACLKEKIKAYEA